jgi:hypothetical protein
MLEFERPERILTQEDIENLGYEVEEILPRVFKIKNFATPEQVKSLFDEASSYTQEDWSARYLSELKKHALEKFGSDDLEDLVEKGHFEVTWDFADKNVGVADRDSKLFIDLNKRCQEIFDVIGNLEATGFLMFQRLYAGSELISHWDDQTDLLVAYAAVLYLNDDYNGGELFFPEFGFDTRPEPGSLVVFPSGKLYEHGVRPVKEGPTRYVIPVFVKIGHKDGPMAGWAPQKEDVAE